MAGNIYLKSRDRAVRDFRVRDSLPRLVDTPEFPFMVEDSFTDVTILADGKRLYFSRAVLAAASGVLERRFLTEFKEKKKIELKLADHSHKDVVDLMALIHPGCYKELDVDIALNVLPIANDYTMKSVKEMCEKFLVKLLKTPPQHATPTPRGNVTKRAKKEDSRDNIVYKCLLAAERSEAKNLLEICVKLCSNPDIPLKEMKDNDEISDSVKAQIYEHRMDTITKKLHRVSVDLEKERQEKNHLKKELDDHLSIAASTPNLSASRNQVTLKGSRHFED